MRHSAGWRHVEASVEVRLTPATNVLARVIDLPLHREQNAENGVVAPRLRKRAELAAPDRLHPLDRLSDGCGPEE